MRFDFRTLMRTINALAIAALMFFVTLSPALAQGQKNKRHKDRGNHYGWTRGRHVGWEHSRHHRARRWRNDDNWRRRANSRHRRNERRDYRRYQRRNRVAYYGPPVREWRTQRRYANWRNRRY